MKSAPTNYRPYLILIPEHEGKGKGFSVKAKRWFVERTWAWLENCRGLTRD